MRYRKNFQKSSIILAHPKENLQSPCYWLNFLSWQDIRHNLFPDLSKEIQLKKVTDIRAPWGQNTVPMKDGASQRIL